MADDLTFGVAIKGTGDGSVASEAKAAREELVALKQETENLGSSTSKLTAQQEALRQAWIKDEIAADNARDKAWALANGYKEVDGQLIKAKASTEEATRVTGGMSRSLATLGREAVRGDFAQMPGTLLSMASHSNLAASSMLGMGLAIATPVAALGALALAAHAGSQEVEAMNRAVEMTSGYSGQTANSLRTMAQSLSDTTQLTIGQAKDLATQLAASGKIGAESFDNIARAITSYARVSGEDIDKVTPKLLKSFEDPTKGAIELNSRMHFLSAAELERIDILQRTGQATEAQTYLAEALSVHLYGQTREVGLLASAWHGLGKAASGAWDSLMGIGRADTLDEKIKAAKELLMSAAQGGNMEAVQRRQLELAELLKQKGKEVAETNASTAAAKKITDDNELATLAKQNSELWKEYETTLKIAQLTGAATPDAPSMDAVKADAAAGLAEKNNKGEGLDKLLEQARKFDEQLVESHKTAFEKTMHDWQKLQDEMIAAGKYGAKERERHEVAFSVATDAEVKKRIASAEKEQAMNEKRLAQEQIRQAAYYGKISADAENAGADAQTRSKRQYDRELIDLEKNHQQMAAKVKDDHVQALAEEAAYQQALLDLKKKHDAEFFYTEVHIADAIRAFKAGDREKQVTSTLGFLTAVTALNASNNEDSFKANKMFAVAQATVHTYLAATEAFSKAGGGYAGFIAAAASVAYGLAQVAAINATNYGGGGGGGSVGYSGGIPSQATSPGIPVSSQPVAAAVPGTGVAQTTTQVNLTIIGARDNPDAPLLSYNSFVTNFVPLFQQAKDNGHLVDLNVVMA